MKKKNDDTSDIDKINEDNSDVPDGGWGWIVVLSSFMCNVLIDGIGLAYGVLLPRLVEHFQATRSKVSLVGSVLLGTYFCTGPVAGGLVNKFGCRKITIVGSLVATVGVIIASLSPDLDILIVTYGLIGGIGFGMIYLPSIVVVGLYFEKKRPIASGIAVCGSGIGSFTLAPVLEFLLEVYYWRGVLLIMAGFILNGAVFGMLMRPIMLKSKTKEGGESISKVNRTTDLVTCEADDKTNESQPFLRCDHNTTNNVELRTTKILHSKSMVDISDLTHNSYALATDRTVEEQKAKQVVTDRQFRSLPDIKYSHSIDVISDQTKSTSPVRSILNVVLEIFDFSLLLNPSFILIFTGNFFNTAAKYIPYMYLVDRVILLGISSSDAALLLSIIGVTNTIGRFLSAMIANIKRVNALVVLIIGLLIASVTVFLQPFCTVYPALVVFSVMYGLSVGGSSTALTSIILCDLLGVKKLAKSFGLLCFARGIACVIGPWLAGKVFQYTGNYDVSFYVSGGMFATGALLRCLILLPAVKQWTKSKDENEIVIES